MTPLATLGAIFAYVPAQRNHAQALISASPRTRLLAELSEQGVKTDKVTIHAHRSLDASEKEEDTPCNVLTPHLMTCKPLRTVDLMSATIMPPCLEAARWWLERPGSALPIKLNAHMVKGTVSLNAWSLFTSCLAILDVHSASRLIAVEGLADCRQLERVNVSHCRMLKDFSCLASLSALRHLKASCNRHLTSLDFLNTTPLLETLAVSECKNVKDWSPLAALPHLRRLDVRFSSLNSVAWAPFCPSLEHLDLSNCEFVVDANPLASLRCLKILLAQGSSIADLEGLACCSRLDTLCVYDYQVASDKACEHKAALERHGATVLVQ